MCSFRSVGCELLKLHRICSHQIGEFDSLKLPCNYPFHKQKMIDIKFLLSMPDFVLIPHLWYFWVFTKFCLIKIFFFHMFFQNYKIVVTMFYYRVFLIKVYWKLCSWEWKHFYVFKCNWQGSQHTLQLINFCLVMLMIEAYRNENQNISVKYSISINVT